MIITWAEFRGGYLQGSMSSARRPSFLPASSSAAVSDTPQPQLPPRLLPPPAIVPLPAGALGASAYSSFGGGGGRRFCIHATMLLDSASAVKAAKALSPISASSCVCTNEEGEGEGEGGGIEPDQC